MVTGRVRIKWTTATVWDVRLRWTLLRGSNAALHESQPGREKELARVSRLVGGTNRLPPACGPGDELWALDGGIDSCLANHVRCRWRGTRCESACGYNGYHKVVFESTCARAPSHHHYSSREC